jgi:transcriptional regulator with XRE-family HTH domain
MKARIDSRFIALRRFELGISRRYVAKQVAVSVSVIRRLESMPSDHGVSTRLLAQLADVLSVDIRQLFAGELEEITGALADDIKVEACLVRVGKMVNRDDLARGLAWKLPRVTAALEALEQRLEGTGQRLNQGRFGWYGLVPAGEALTRKEIRATSRAHLADHGMNLIEANTLNRVLRADLEQRKGAKRSANAAVSDVRSSRIVSAGLVEPLEGMAALSVDAQFSLCLLDERARRPVAAGHKAFRPREQRGGPPRG